VPMLPGYFHNPKPPSDVPPHFVMLSDFNSAAEEEWRGGYAGRGWILP
jgi:hypothetical protein